ncbi:major capsid protein [Murid herpesvirus 3]|uniref:Major capsid protein n=2 Tax=Murid betaherpesvirus 3 TaxID=2560603 RepID=A0A1P8VIW6_9BETA|nr:major capsid protein [Murine roseolovirus]APZ76288.1 major capsid protein [Murid betaherpesvirus 3]AYH64708.1 major capsid protein [Murid herpesvirus 3]
MDYKSASQLLPKIPVSANALQDIKIHTAEELFDNLLIYYGDNPENYNISFEGLLGIFCNSIEWANFFYTPIAVCSNVVKFDDLAKMSLGKVLFHIQVPRVATGNDTTAPKQATITITKFTEKRPINISFELSAACLQHLEDTFKNTILDKILNINAINTVLRSLKNSADALQRGLVHAFLKVILQKSPPQFILKTILDNKVDGRQSLSRVQRSNIFQNMKRKFNDTIFFLNRTNNIQFIYKVLIELVDSVTDSILENKETYITEDNTHISGSIIATSSVIQQLSSLLSLYINSKNISVPTTHGHFIMSKENAIIAIAHHAIMGDFNSYIDKPFSTQNTLPESEFFEHKQKLESLKMNTMLVGDKTVVLDSLNKIYKNTDTKNPLESDLELTFFFPMGLFLPHNTGFSTMENKVKLNNTMENNLPLATYFYNKDNILQKIEYSDLLKFLCHPLIYDSTILKRIFEALPLPKGEEYQKLCQNEYVRMPPFAILPNLYEVYADQEEVPKNINILKNELSISDFYKPGNITLKTELSPMYDISYQKIDRKVNVLCTPRIMLGNMPLPLTSAEFHEARAAQIAEISKNKVDPYEMTIQFISDSLTSNKYPEFAYIIELLVHGYRSAFQALQNTITQAIIYWFTTKQILLFCNNYEMIKLICNNLADMIPPNAYNYYRNLLLITRFIKRIIMISNTNEQLCGEPLSRFQNGIFDPRLICPFLHHIPRNVDTVLIAGEYPLSPNSINLRNYDISDLERMDSLDSTKIFDDTDRVDEEENINSKIFYFCVLPTLTNNRACGAGFDVKSFTLDFFYNDQFISNDDLYEQFTLENEILKTAIQDLVGSDNDPTQHAKNVFMSLCYIPENTKIIQSEGLLDPAQRHGNNFRYLQHLLYNGVCLITPINFFKKYIRVIPFHKFYSSPQICAGTEPIIHAFLNRFPHYNRFDGGFPLPKPLAHEFHNWHRTPFAVYSSSCPNTIHSMITLACMHQKLSAVSTAIQCKQKCHPGFAITLVRTDTFDVDTLMYGTKASTSIILNEPVITKEVRDVVSIYNMTQQLHFVDMGLGYSSTTSIAALKRIRTDMGSTIQNLFSVFPLQSFNNNEVNGWIRQFVGADKQKTDSETMNILSFGGIPQKPPSIILHGQQAVCDCIITPVTCDVNFFKQPNNPRGRASTMLGVEPYNEEMAIKALYDHSQTDSHGLYATVNPWASQKGSLSDIMFNREYNNQLGYNPKIYSPNTQFFTTNEILEKNKLLFKIITEYCSRSKTCIDNDSEVQYKCVEGTENLTQKPCQFLQEAYPIHSSSSQGLLESRTKNGNSQTSETHFGNFALGEIIPFERIIKNTL